MKRADNCVDSKITHIRFKYDSLVFEFAKSKGQQEGEEHVGPWHVYVSPYEPAMCHVLTLAKYVFCYPSVVCGKSPLFEGTNQYNRYSKIFAKLVEDHKKELGPLGVKEGGFGIHSLS